MTRLGKLCLYMMMSAALVGMSAQSLADTSPPTAFSTRAYFVRAYAMVIAGEALAAQCDMLHTWQQLSLTRHAKTLKGVMAERLPVKALDQAKRMARDLVERHSDCGTSATSIIDDSLFAAHGLVYSRAEGTEPGEITPELRAFIAWAKAEIETGKRKRQTVAAAKKKTAKRPPSADLKRFKTIVQAYYLERRCRHLSRADARSYWTMVKTAHKKAVAALGVNAVRAVQAAAAQRANRQAKHCGTGTRAQVVAGYGLIRGKPKAQRLRASLTLTSRSSDDFLGR